MKPLDALVRRIHGVVAERDKGIATKFGNLPADRRTMAARGIAIYERNCRRAGVDPDVSAMREIIEDARAGLYIYLENERDRRAANHSVTVSAQSSLNPAAVEL